VDFKVVVIVVVVVVVVVVVRVLNQKPQLPCLVSAFSLLRNCAAYVYLRLRVLVC
jgi:hypothetical protein